MEVILKERAQASIRRIALYIFKKGYPDTAIKFAKQLEEFALTLANFPDKHPLCRQKSYAKRKFHCVPFESSYIFIYKVISNRLIVLNIVQAARIR